MDKKDVYRITFSAPAKDVQIILNGNGISNEICPVIKLTDTKFAFLTNSILSEGSYNLLVNAIDSNRKKLVDNFNLKIVDKDKNIADLEGQLQNTTPSAVIVKDDNSDYDGGFNERREYTYTVEEKIRLLKPYNVNAMNDDYQDVKVINETDKYVDLDVVFYPYNTNDQAIGFNMNL